MPQEDTTKAPSGASPVDRLARFGLVHEVAIWAGDHAVFCPCDSDGVLVVALVDEAWFSITHRPTGMAIVSGYCPTREGMAAAQMHRDRLIDVVTFDWSTIDRRGVFGAQLTPELDAVRLEAIEYVEHQNADDDSEAQP